MVIEILVINMAAMHWEARRKQVVIDRKFEAQQRLIDMRENGDNYYNEASIRQIAEEVSRDVATPIPSMLNRSYTQLAKRHHSATSRQDKPIATFEDRLFNRKLARERAYSAKLPNRYNSVSYTQQH